MKPPSIKLLLLASALSAPLLHAQDSQAKLREIEQKVLREKYRSAVQALAGTPRASGTGELLANRENIGKQVLWLTALGGQIEGEKIASGSPEDLADTAGKLNTLAWDMIAPKDGSPRNPETALKLAIIALELSGGNQDLKPKVLDTKARALFLLGKQREAIAEQEKAVAAATDAEEKAALGKTLATYKQNQVLVASPSAPGQAPAGAATIERKLRDIILPSINLEDTSLEEAIDFLRTRSVELDTAETNPTKRGINFVIRLPRPAPGAAGKPEEQGGPRVKELRLRNAPIGTVLQYICDASGMFFKIDDSAVSIVSKDAAGEPRPSMEAGSGTEYLVKKLKTIIIPSINLEDTSLEETIDFLRIRSVELDTTETNQSRRGVNFLIKLPAPAAGSKPDPDAYRIKELRLRNVPLDQALKYICQATKLRYKVDEHAVTLISPENSPADFFNRTFTLPSGFATPGVPIQDQLKASGVGFPQGASATMDASGSLVVRNTPPELDKIEKLIQSAGKKGQ